MCVVYVHVCVRKLSHLQMKTQVSVEQLVTELKMFSQEVSCAVLGTTYLSRVLVQ